MGVFLRSEVSSLPGSHFQTHEIHVAERRRHFGVRHFSATHLGNQAKGSGRGTSDSQSAAHPLWNWPNAISAARMFSGPVIASLILHGEWNTAFIALGVAGASDWLDGFVARRFNQGSVVGSYLDPLADKMLICCTAGALAYEGTLYPPLAALIIGRDLFLVSGAVVLRMRSLQWRWPGWQEFFRTTPHSVAQSLTKAASNKKESSRKPEGGCGEGNIQSRMGGRGVDPAPFVEPLYVSKVNTVSQLGLIAGCITHSWYGAPPEGVLFVLGGLTGVLTLTSWHAYWQQHKLASKNSTPTCRRQS